MSGKSSTDARLFWLVKDGRLHLVKPEDIRVGDLFEIEATKPEDHLHGRRNRYRLISPMVGQMLAVEPVEVPETMPAEDTSEEHTVPGGAE